MGLGIVEPHANLVAGWTRDRDPGIPGWHPGSDLVFRSAAARVESDRERTNRLAVCSYQRVLNEFEQRGLCAFPISSVGRNNRDIWSKIEALTDFVDRVMKLAVECVDSNNKWHLGFFEVLDRAERVFEASGVENDNRTDRATSQLVPHEAETILAWRSEEVQDQFCLLYTSPSPRDRQKSRMPSSA